MKRRDANDVRKVDGKFTKGWQFVQIVTMILIGIAVASVLLGNLVMLYVTFGVLLVMAIAAKIVITRDRRRYYVPTEAPYVPSEEPEDRLRER